MKKTLSLFTLSIGGKLLVGIIIVLTLTTIIAIVGIKSINKLSETTNEIVDESLEHSAILNLKLNFQQLLLHTNYYIIHGNKSEIIIFKESLKKVKEWLNECKEIVENQEEKMFLEKFETYLYEIEQLLKDIFEIKNPIENPQEIKKMEEIEKIANSASEEIEKTLKISEGEVNKYVALNESIRQMNSIIIIYISLFIAVALLIGGFFYVKGLTNPLNQLIKTTEKISADNLSVTAEVNTKDEIGNLSASFNTMIGILEKTTVSKDFFKSVLNKITKSIIITNANDEIVIVNKATTELLKCKEEIIIGKHLVTILSAKGNKKDFKKNEIIQELKEKKTLNNIYNTYYSKEGNKIPVIFSGSLMYNNSNVYNGMICIAYHPYEHFEEGNNQAKEEEASYNSIKTMGDIPLTKREREIIKLIAEDYTNNEIADKLFISIRTVETHRKNIMQKLHAKSVIALVKYASLNGII